MNPATYNFTANEFLEIKEIFDTQRDNRTNTIAKAVGMTTAKVSYIIDCYLSTKPNYMGANVPPAMSGINIKTQKKRPEKPKILAVYKDGWFKGEFVSLAEACRVLGVSYERPRAKLRRFKQVEIKTKNGIYKYIKL